MDDDPEKTRRLMLDAFQKGDLVVHDMSQWQQLVRNNPNMVMDVRPWNVGKDEPDRSMTQSPNRNTFQHTR